jgi:hypothetical protein
MNTNKQGLTGKKWLILVITLITAGVHFSLNFSMGKFDPLFTLNGLGYLTLIWAYLFTPGFLLRYRNWIRILFIAFTVVTIIAWVFLGQPYTVIGYIDKTLELILVILLLTDRSNE